MSEFEYLAVFLSIIFGLSLTHILAGVIRSLYRGLFDDIHLVLTAYFFIVLLINWWTAYSWQGQEVWTFDLFLIVILWSVSHYIGAITLYPPRVVGNNHQFEFRRNWFLWAGVVGTSVMDVFQTAMRGEVFSPWYYLPFVSHYIALALLAIFVDSTRLLRWVAWYLFVSLTVWSLIVRRFLI